MSRLDDITTTLQVTDELFDTIKGGYHQSLRSKAIDPKLTVYIKNYLENLRSCLDYIASEIAENILSIQKSHKPYYPVACQDATQFRKHVDKNLPGLETVHPTLFSKLEALQPWNQEGCRALPKLSKLVNDNKHDQLSAQTRTESKGLRIRFPGGAGIDIGAGASISGGGIIGSGDGWITPGGGTISGDSPATIGQNVQQTVQVWVSFSFTETGDEVLTLLDECRLDVRRIVSELTPDLFP